MEFLQTELNGVILIKPDVFRDNRGFFLESYSREKFQHAGIDTDFIQDNHSRSVKRGVIRGLHFQAPPAAQSKLVRVTKGAVMDIVVDLREQSPTFGKWSSFELTEENFNILFVPKGFAHGFCTLTENCELQYKVDYPYAPSLDRGIKWNDPELKIDWPVKDPVLSDKDASLPSFRETEICF
ncbi:dTDP-4-dehydrorhamnose 3,5-epimerase [Chitinispirillales bacterium ANBcel5]|uniref:dTDP-4-dehydrorhamnose 3,5-epimerase n=1 Tax=Cellulosispirillum alkaliphilum TaxID=3039283 RepID=UPI002A56E3D1|nr:dTDP-4-dehydrorhamnose 3,5-epimerase [Chitinispirillales bacterium ANBcel5]